MKFSPRSALLLFSVLIVLSLSACPPARAWGCQGHQIIAYIAEANLNRPARAKALKILAASPIDPHLSRYCQPRGTDPFADASTWADDIRNVRPETAAWHFIDIPRGAQRGSLEPFCPPSTGCVVTALETHIGVLNDPRSSAAARADALRFIIHFVGDIHQPLHDATNSDDGGNCVPLEFFGDLPREIDAVRESFHPNLHWVWDVGIIHRFERGETPQQLARELDRRYRLEIPTWTRQPANFAAWAWEAHALADSVAYGELPRAIAVAQPRAIRSCADDDIALRMLSVHENLGPAYESAAAPVVQQQLVKAGARLAAVLNSILQ
jgi:hypothetical protein